MQWGFVLALVIAIPLILLPAVFVWYINAGGIYTVFKDIRERRYTRKKGVKEMAKHG